MTKIYSSEMKNRHSDFQNSRKSSTSKLKIQVPQVLASKSMVFQVQIKYQKNSSTIQGIQVLLATLVKRKSYVMYYLRWRRSSTTRDF